jgi:UDP-2,3-diacylglucosamine hydrolase
VDRLARAVAETLFISDLHLSADRPEANERFFRFLGDTAARAEALYVLGDLFEYWIGDDDLDDSFNSRIAAAFAELTATGVKLYFMHGNRDFLLGDAFAARCGGALLSDPTLIELYDTPTLLMHGDSLCTDDKEYMAFRERVRDPEWLSRFLAQPLAVRRAQAQGLRERSEQEKQTKTADIMDVALATVQQVLREHGYPRLIHGHTHRPAHHIHVVDGLTCERWVLPDWYGQGGYLRADVRGCRPQSL